jgi:hypothetical protein
VAPRLAGAGLIAGFTSELIVATRDAGVLRPALALFVAAVVALTGTWLLRRGRDGRLSTWLTWVGSGALVALTAARVVRELARPEIGPALEGWLLPAALVLCAVALLTDRTGILVLAVLAGVFLAEAAALGSPGGAALRVTLMAWTFSAVHAIAFWLARGLADRLFAWGAIALAALAALVGVTLAVPDPIELATVPVAIGLLVSGGVWLATAATARSWPWLGPGLAVLLIPSLLLDIADNPLWRVTGLGVVSIAVLVAGLIWRLQAPFVLGCVVVVVHAVAQLWPWIAAAYNAVPWWLWLGVGGVLLIVLAARYERRIRDVKAIVMRVSALR